MTCLYYLFRNWVCSTLITVLFKFLFTSLFSFASIFREPSGHLLFHMHALTGRHTIPFTLLVLYIVQLIGWIRCAIPYGGLSCWIWSRWWMKKPMSHRRFVLPHLPRFAVAYLPHSLRPFCQPTDTMPFKLSRLVVHCLPFSCTS